MITSPSETLYSIELHAERANVQELRLLTQNVRSLRASLDDDDLDYANVLLLKLDRLLREQTLLAA